MIAMDVAGHGRPLVLLHGVGASREIWRRIVPELQAERLVLVPDLPGFGDSPPVGPGFSLAQTAGAVADALEKRVSERFDLVGNSLGGAVALIIARRRPDLVRRLVLVAPAGFSPRPALISSALGRLSDPALALRRMLGGPLAGSELARRILLWGTVAAPQRLSAQDARAMIQASRGSSRIGAALAAVLQANLHDELTWLDRPLGLIWGERDRVIPIGMTQSILVLRPEAVVVTIPQAAHVPQFERPVAFLAALHRVLESVRPKPGP